MTHWTFKRRISLGVHAGVVLIPFGFSTVSAALFWHALFDSWLLAVPMVAVIDVLALLGLVLFIAGIASPFVWLRHLLPFISIVPLGVELYGALDKNEPWVAWAVTLLATGVLVVVAWKCFETIERLFVPPIEAAREKAREHMARVRVELAVLEEMQSAADAFAHERMRYHAPTIAARVPEQVEARPQMTAKKKHAFSPEVRYKMARRRASRLRYRRIQKNGGTYTQQEWLDLCARYDNQCVRCHEVLPLTADHVIPVVRGGINSIDNIQPLCRSCNSIKGTGIEDYRPDFWKRMPTNIGMSEVPSAVQDRPCPQCGKSLDAARFGAAQRWGYCSECKPIPSTNGHRKEAI